MKPADLLPPGSYNRAVGTIVDTLGKAEPEAAAALLARYHEAHGLDAWGDVPLGAFWDWAVGDELVKRWTSNPFLRPDFTGLFQRGLFVGWVPGNKASVGRLSAECIEHLEHPKLWQRTRINAAPPPCARCDGRGYMLGATDPGYDAERPKCSDCSGTGRRRQTAKASRGEP